MFIKCFVSHECQEGGEAEFATLFTALKQSSGNVICNPHSPLCQFHIWRCDQVC